LYRLEGSGFTLLKFDGGFPKRLVTQCIQYFTNVLSSLSKQRDLLYLRLYRSSFDGD
jgi:hypothetical protein